MIDKTLASYQDSFLEGIFKKSDTCLNEDIIPIGNLSIDDIYNVYRNDYFARLTEALGENYEAIWAVIGDDDFFQIAESFIKKYPSNLKDLTFYGREFPDFLKQHKLIEGYSFLVDLALFEQAFWRCFHRPRIESNLELNKVDQEELLTRQIILSDKVELINWDYCIFDLWKQRRSGFGNFSLEIEQAQSIIMFKNSDTVSVFELSKDQFIFLNQVKEGHTVQSLLETVEISSKNLQYLFEILGQSGVISALSALR